MCIRDSPHTAPFSSANFLSTKKAALQYLYDNGRAASSLLKWYLVLINLPGTIHAPVWQILTGGSLSGFPKDNSNANIIPEVLQSFLADRNSRIFESGNALESEVFSRQVIHFLPEFEPGLLPVNNSLQNSALASDLAPALSDE